MSKLQELILYIARRSEDDRHFGANKLNKLLFYSDFLAYAKTGRSFTGAPYERLEHGPAPRGLAAALEELKPACAEAERDWEVDEALEGLEWVLARSPERLHL